MWAQWVSEGTSQASVHTNMDPLAVYSVQTLWQHLQLYFRANMASELNSPHTNFMLGPLISFCSLNELTTAMNFLLPKLLMFRGSANIYIFTHMETHLISSDFFPLRSFILSFIKMTNWCSFKRLNRCLTFSLAIHRDVTLSRPSLQCCCWPLWACFILLFYYMDSLMCILLNCLRKLFIQLVLFLIGNSSPISR